MIQAVLNKYIYEDFSVTFQKLVWNLRKYIKVPTKGDNHFIIRNEIPEANIYDVIIHEMFIGTFVIN